MPCGSAHDRGELSPLTVSELEGGWSGRIRGCSLTAFGRRGQGEWPGDRDDRGGQLPSPALGGSVEQELSKADLMGRRK
jgi:hypothetical protein